MRTLTALFFFSFFISLTSCYKEEFIEPVPSITIDSTTLVINGKQCAFDSESSTYYFSILPSDTNQLELIIAYPHEWGVLNFNQEDVVSGSSVIFNTIQLNSPVGLSFANEKNIKLAFLTLPIISIFTDEIITDDSSAYSAFSILEPGVALLKQNIASFIEVRGGYSKSLPKISYNIELFENTDYLETEKYSLANLREDDDWILDAMYIDPIRMRNRVSFDIWLKMVEEANYLNSSKITNGINGAFTILFLNNKCVGVYCLNERFDKKQFEVRDTYNEYGGVLYKGKDWTNVLLFREYIPFTDSEYSNGWKLVYPDVDENFLPYWSALDTLTQFIVNSDDQTFKDDFYKHMNVRNVIDYYILLNLTSAYDNTGKNLYLSKYNEYLPFVISPWDLDGTWGLYWDGSHVEIDETLNMAIVDRLISSSAYNFTTQLKDNWTGYRQTFLQTDTIMDLYNSYADVLQQNSAYKLENDIWDLQLNPEDELVFIENWIDHRFEYLDNYFTNLN